MSWFLLTLIQSKTTTGLVALYETVCAASPVPMGLVLRSRTTLCTIDARTSGFSGYERMLLGKLRPGKQGLTQCPVG
jgi:hypothetical protein